MIHLSAHQRVVIQTLLAEYVPQMSVLAYGSRVNGASHEASDLDLVVMDPVDPTRAQARMGALREAFRESSLPISIDLVDWARIPETFREEIQKNCEPIWPVS